MKQRLLIGAAAVLCMAAPYVCSAQGNSLATEVKTARAHALMAVRADSLTKSHTHLHHVINCLVGPSGPSFDAKAADPCKGMGDGALPDSEKGSHAGHEDLVKALHDAKAGLKADNLDGAHKAANRAADALTTAAKTDGK